MRCSLFLLMLVGCGGGDDDDDAAIDGGSSTADGAADDADGGADDADAAPGGAVTIEDIQTGEATGEVSLTGVVVTALSKDGKHLWVADDLTAAASSGIYVFRAGAAAVLDEDVVIGATVDVAGEVEEFDIGEPATGDTLTQIASATVSNPVAPEGAPVPLAGQPIATLASIDDAEPFESVLVQITNVSVMSTATGNRVNLTDGVTTIVMDDDIFSYPAPDIGACYASITGILGLNLFDDQRRLWPRSSTDLVLGDASDCE